MATRMATCWSMRVSMRMAIPSADYRKVLKVPIAINDIRFKLSNNEYASVQQFRYDVDRRVVRNVHK